MMKRFFLLLVLLASTGCSYSFFERLSSYPPGTTEGDFPNFDHYNLPTTNVKKLPSELFIEAIDLLDEIFLVKKQGDYKCIDPNTFRKFIDLFFRTAQGTSPQLDYLCLFKKNKDYDEELRWVLSETSSDVWTILPPRNLVDVDMHVLKSVDMSTESSLHIEVDNKKSTLRLEGVKFNLSSSVLDGTAFTWVPESLLRFDVDHIQISDDGKYMVKLILPIGFPLSIKGILEAFVSRDGRLRLTF